MSISAAILAAGTSSRLGQPKQLLKLGGETLIHRTARVITNAPIERALVVVNSSHATRWKRNCAIYPSKSSSMPRRTKAWPRRCAWPWLLRARPMLLLLTPCDLPLLSSEHLRALIEQYQREGAPIVASRYNETLGAPLIIARELWPELLQLRGDVGARRVIMKHSASWVEWPDGAIDVDTRADWERLGL